MNDVEKRVDSEAPVDLMGLLHVARQMEAAHDLGGCIDLYRSWLMKLPNAPTAHLAWYEFGRLLEINGEYERSAAAFTAALEQRPDLDMAAIALGYQYERKGQSDLALTALRNCLESGGEPVALLNNIGRICDGIFRHDEAEAALWQSWKLNNQQPEVVITLMFLRQRLCQWPIDDPALGLGGAKHLDHFGPISSLAIFNDPVLNLESTKAFLRSKEYDAIIPLKMRKRLQQKLHLEQPKIRVGFLSADFRMHATSVFFGSLLEKLDRNQFEVYALDITVAKEVFGTVREDLLSKADYCYALQACGDEEAIAQIRALELDVLVDMAGLTAGARPAIVAHRVAPTQVSYLGFIGSSGIDALDYIISTPDMLLHEHASGYSEKPLYLPGSYFAINKDIVDLDVPDLSREQCGLPPNAFVYCALLNSYKITQSVFECWMRILSQVESSVLWLVGDNETVKKNLIKHAAKFGVNSSRLIFMQRVHPGHFRSCLSCADVFLDTSPYGNGATAREAILANLPMLTCPGNTMMSRLSGHLMLQLQMNDFVVRDWDTYENFAVKLGKSPKLISQYKGAMKNAQKSNPLFDADKFAQEFGMVLQRAHAKS
jgi:predicted O-linked N-acetylglucosamine transferase (SPINDLY family)